MVVGLPGNESPDSNRFTPVTPKSENDVRLQATLGNQNPTGLPVGAVSVDGSGEHFRNGIGILDDNGKPFEVLSVGMESVTNAEDALSKTSLSVEGHFASKRLFV